MSSEAGTLVIRRAAEVINWLRAGFRKTAKVDEQDNGMTGQGCPNVRIGDNRKNPILMELKWGSMYLFALKDGLRLVGRARKLGATS